MTKYPKDYSKSLIYKIVCLDPEITDCYVGSTLHFRQRKYKHKSCCNNLTCKEYNFNLYKFIREHGGWENWEMLQIEEFPCNSSHELALQERFHLEQLKATLNKCIPGRSLAESQSAYYQANKEQKKEQAKEYYQINKEKILERQYQKHACPCGGKYTNSYKSEHFKKKIHQAYLNQNELNTNT